MAAALGPRPQAQCAEAQYAPECTRSLTMSHRGAHRENWALRSSSGGESFRKLPEALSCIALACSAAALCSPVACRQQSSQVANSSKAALAQQEPKSLKGQVCAKSHSILETAGLLCKPGRGPHRARRKCTSTHAHSIELLPPGDGEPSNMPGGRGLSSAGTVSHQKTPDESIRKPRKSSKAKEASHMKFPGGLCGS